MFERVSEAESILKEVVAALEPEVLEGAAAVALVERFSSIERLGAAGKALAARRVAQSGVWRSSGERSPAHFLASQTGVSVGNAVGVLETAERVAELPGTNEALRAGRLSEVQAKEIASAAAADPTSEDELLKAAERDGMAGLKERCGAVKAAALPDELDRHEALRRQRYLRHYSDPDGAFRLDGCLTPEAGATLLACLAPYKERIFVSARKEGRREPYDAYAADALVAMAEHVRDCKEEPDCSGPKAMVHVRVDHSALLRGEAVAGETCEIPGVGPIPVATARALANDAILAALVSDGVDVTAVSHPGRTIPAHLRSALIERDRVCVVPGCDTRHPLEIDHLTGITEPRPTRLGNLARLCKWHHYLKTHRGYRLGGGPGEWSWAAPRTPETRDPAARAGPGP